MQANDSVVRACSRSQDRRLAMQRCVTAQRDYEQSARLRFANAGEKLALWCTAHDEALRQGCFGLPVPPPMKAPRPAPARAAAAVPARAAATIPAREVAFNDGWVWSDRMRGEPPAIHALRLQRAR